MLDSDTTNDQGSTGDTTDPAPPAKAARKRAPRKAAAKAGPPPAAPPAEQDPAPATPDGPAPRKRAPRKAAAKKAAVEVETVEATPVQSGDEPSVDTPASPPAKKTARRTRKAAAPTVTDEPATAPEPAAPAAGTSLFDAAGAATAEVSTPARKTRKRTAPKAALFDAATDTTTDTTTGTAAQAPADAAAPADGSAPVLAAPGVLFLAPTAEEEPAAPRRRRRATKAAAAPAPAEVEPDAEDEDPEDSAGDPADVAEGPAETPADSADNDTDETDDAEDLREAAIEQANGARRRRRRGRRGRGGSGSADSTDSSDGPDADSADEGGPAADANDDAATDEQSDDGETGEGGTSRRRRRRRRSGTGDDSGQDDPPNTVTHVREPKKAKESRDDGDDGVRGIKGSTRLEAKRQRRRDGRDTSRRRAPILTESEFLARREAVDRVMAVRQRGDRTQIAVLEDGVLVEHYVTRASATSYVGNVYLGRVQNVLPSMEAAFIDIGKGRNGVLYAGEVNWDAAGLDGKSRAIEQALKSGDPVLVQVTKDPIGHKGARLTSQVSLPGRFLVYVPGGGMTGISRRLPDTERARLKAILKKIVPEDAGVIVRTAAEGASEEDLTRDVERLQAQWESIESKANQKKNAPVLVHGEPDLAIRVVRDVFNEDFTSLVVEGDDAWSTISEYLGGVAPDLAERASRHTKDTDLFHDLRVDESLAKALDRKVWLPSGGSLVIDRTEAMTVVDVNTGKFVGSGGNLEQTVTRNNLEAAEEIVRQLRLRDVGGIVVIDFIDMVLESNRELVLRRLTECLGRDRTKHQVAEVTSLGLVQMTRKRVGEGLLEAFSEPCEHCRGRGVVVHTEPVDQPAGGPPPAEDDRPKGKRRRGGRGAGTAAEPETVEVELTPAATEEQRRAAAAAIAAIHQAAGSESDDADPAGYPESTDSAEVAELASGLVQAVMRVDSHGTVEQVAAEPASEPSDPTREAVISTAASETGTPAPQADPAGAHTVNGAAPEPVEAAEPAEQSEGSDQSADRPTPAGRRRRRAASRPAGPPVGTP